MSDSKDNKSPTYPASAYIRTSHRPGIQVEYPETKRKQSTPEKMNSLKWLMQADKYEPPTPSTEEKPVIEDKGKGQESGESGGSLSWLLEADKYNPPKKP